MRWKKPSGGMIASQPDSPTLFIDRNAGGRIFRDLLAAKGLNVVLHDDEFPQAAADEDWLAVVGQKGWVIVTGDKATTKSPLFLQQLAESQANVFVLLGLNGETAAGKADCILENYPRIVSLVKDHKPPALWRIGKQGTVHAVDFHTVLQRMRRSGRL
jgi:PIN like domain